MKALKTFGPNQKVIVIGASGGIGAGFVNILARQENVEHVYALSRGGQSLPDPKVTSLSFDFRDETNIANTANRMRAFAPFDLIIVATGLLQGDGISPEKNMKALDSNFFAKSFEINTIGPALTAKHFLPLLRRDRKAVFAALSARIGSISDNHLGGWYAYRASKAALNMVIKTLAIEQGRRSKDMIIIGLHPGTVDTGLSKPFQNNVPDGKLFPVSYSVDQMLKVINDVTPQKSGSLIAWDGKVVPF